MFRKIGNWFKGHRMLRVMLPGALALVLVVAMVVPVALADITYLDVAGAYTVSGKIPAKYLDGSKHPNIPCGTLTIVQAGADQTLTGTLTMMGEDVTLTGLVGPGNRPWISLTGDDGAGTYVTINGRAIKGWWSSDVKGISGKIEGFITSDGEKGTDFGSNGEAVVVADSALANSGTYSALLTAGNVAGSVFVQFNNLRTPLDVKKLSRLPKGYGFWFNLENLKSPGPQMELRFISADCTTPSGANHVDITVFTLGSPYTGDGKWYECAFTSDSFYAMYYGNTATGTEFGWESGVLGGTGAATTLGETLAAIEANTVVVAAGTDVSTWKLSRVRVEYWAGNEADCYIDDVKIGNITYTLEPTKFSGTFKAKKQALD